MFSKKQAITFFFFVYNVFIFQVKSANSQDVKFRSESPKVEEHPIFTETKNNFTSESIPPKIPKNL